MQDSNDNLYYIWLTEIKGIGAITGRKLLNIFKSPQKIYESNIDELLQTKVIGNEKAKQIIESKDLTKPKAILKACKDKNIKISNIPDNIFPDPYSLAVSSSGNFPFPQIPSASDLTSESQTG